MIKATIQAREIRIGNIIQFDDTSEDIVRVEYVFQSDEMWFIQWTWISGKGSFKSGNSILEDFEPIPLSPEILEKAGFEIPVNTSSYAYRMGKWAVFLWPTGAISVEFKNIEICELQHLHQLQNLYFSLTGEELTINL